MFARAAFLMSALYLLALACAAGVHADIREGTRPLAAPSNTGATPFAPPFAGPAPDGPGLYAGIKDREGVSVSWVRVNGLKDRGEIIPSVRGTWGDGSVEVPLVDLAMAEVYYSEGKLQADLHLLNGQRMTLVLANPFTELQGWWRQNNYSIPLSGVRQVWFSYVPRAPLSVTDRYGGPTVNVNVQGMVRSLELSGRGGMLHLTSSRGEALDVHFDYARLLSGVDLLSRRAVYMPGRTVRAMYTLSATPTGYARRELRELRVMKDEAQR